MKLSPTQLTIAAAVFARGLCSNVDTRAVARKTGATFDEVLDTYRAILVAAGVMDESPEDDEESTSESYTRSEDFDDLDKAFL